MAIATPAWLRERDGALTPSVDRQSWLVLVNGSPQYRLTPVPIAGQFGCQIVQTVNGQRLDRGSTFPSDDAAIAGALEVLRAKLGW